MPGDVSSQYVSALLFIAPLAEKGMDIKLTTPPESKPYILMTLDCLQKFGVTVSFSEALDEFQVEPQAYGATRYEVEGDWSSASYFLALGATSGEISVTNLNPQSLQGDKIVLDLLKEMGAKIETTGDSVTVKRSRLKAIKADLSDCIDLLPTMAVLAAVAEGTSEFVGIERARIKESDRVAAVSEGLARMGIKASATKEKLTIAGGRPQGAVIDSKNDHRIAMAFSVLGALAGDTVIENAECVTKTYPAFWQELKRIGAEVKLDGK